VIDKIQVSVAECSPRPRVSAGWWARGVSPSPATEQWFYQEGVPCSKQHTHVLTHTHTHSHARSYAHSYTHAYSHTHTHTHTYTFLHTHTLTCTFLCSYLSPFAPWPFSPPDQKCCTPVCSVPTPGHKLHGGRELATLATECPGPKQALSKHGSRWESE